DHFAEEIVERGEDLASLGVVAALLLVDLLLVAAAAILRRHDHRDRRPVVLERVGVGLLGALAAEAADLVLPMRDGGALLLQPGIRRAVALQAGLVLLLRLRRGGRGRLLGQRRS